jgi:hypothetical protein
MQCKVALAYACHRSQPTMAGAWKVVWRTLNTKPRVPARLPIPVRRNDVLPISIGGDGGKLWRARYLPYSEKSADVRSVLLLCCHDGALYNAVCFWGRKARGLRGRCIGPTTADDPSKTAWRDTRCLYREVACSSLHTTSTSLHRHGAPRRERPRASPTERASFRRCTRLDLADLLLLNLLKRL